MLENSDLDKKSLALIVGNKTNWRELAKDCVCFANGNGGTIIIGIEDDKDLPHPKQKIDLKIIEDLNKKLPALTLNTGIAPQIITASNGGEYIALKVFRSAQSIASTTDGRYYIRVSDECKPVMPDQIERLFSKKMHLFGKKRLLKKYC